MSHVHIGLYDALRDAGASEEKARAGAADIPVGQNLTTKEDLLQVKVEINDRIGKVETEIANLRGDVKAQIANLRGDVKAQIANLRGDVKAQIADEFKTLYRYLLAIGATIITVIVGILKLFP